MDRQEYEDMVKRKKEQAFIDSAHLEQLIMSMEEMLESWHPLLHSNSFLHLKKEVTRNKVISFRG